MNKFSKFLILILVVILLIAGVFLWNKNEVDEGMKRENGKEGVEMMDRGKGANGNNGVEMMDRGKGANGNNEAETGNGSTEGKIGGKGDGGVAIPEKIFIKVPFTSQAPFAKWDEYHEEACEEASLIMLKYYWDKKALAPEIAEKEIQKLIKFQIKKYGDYKDSDAAEIVKLAEDYYGLKNLRAVYDFRKEDIKKELAKGNPVIVPAAGRLLGNPNFTPPGPLYHNLVLVGYDGNKIITNDPGTKRGERYIYKLDVLYDAIHDFPGKKEGIENGRKAMIVVGTK